MGIGGEKKPMHEIAETRVYGQVDSFEKILERVKEAGGEITSDEEFPLYEDIGDQEFEVGTERVAEFNLNKMDFQLMLKIETHTLSGEGRQKHIEEMPGGPRAKLSLKRKSQYEDTWQPVDLEDMF